MPFLRSSLPVLFLLAACQSGDAPENRTDPYRFACQIHPGSRGNQIIITANPGDCLNCLNLLEYRLGQAGKNEANLNHITIVLQSRRAVERKQIYKTILSGIDTGLIPVIWNDSLYNAVNREYKGTAGQSLLLIYDAAGKKTLCKPVKEVSGIEPEVQGIF